MLSIFHGKKTVVEDLPAVLQRIEHWHRGSAAHLEHSSGAHLPPGDRFATLLREANRLGRPDAGGQRVLLRAELAILYH